MTHVCNVYISLTWLTPSHCVHTRYLEIGRLTRYQPSRRVRFNLAIWLCTTVTSPTLRYQFCRETSRNNSADVHRFCVNRNEELGLLESLGSYWCRSHCANKNWSTRKRMGASTAGVDFRRARRQGFFFQTRHQEQFKRSNCHLNPVFESDGWHRPSRFCRLNGQFKICKRQ